MFLEYKQADRTGKLVDMPAADTSQTCSVYGVTNPANCVRQAHFACKSCGEIENADINAAKTS
jgi:putative transposase